jgi:hypothetical protein
MSINDMHRRTRAEWFGIGRVFPASSVISDVRLGAVLPQSQHRKEMSYYAVTSGPQELFGTCLLRSARIPRNGAAGFGGSAFRFLSRRRDIMCLNVCCENRKPRLTRRRPNTVDYGTDAIRRWFVGTDICVTVASGLAFLIAR